MNKLTLKRNYKYILFFIFLIIISILFGNTRIISYNFGKYLTKTENSQNNIDNSKDIFNEEIKHSITINLSEEDYDNLLLYYKQNDEKQYIKIDINIDGIEIKDVGIKLKGNKILSTDIENISLEDAEFSYLIKFDKYISGQTYLGNSEVAIISGNSEELKGEYIAYKIFENFGINSPKISFTDLKMGNFKSGDYLIKQVVGDEFIKENFGDDNPIIYKAENSLSFTYLGEDPVEYADLFTQKTNLNNYDLKKLIEVLEFVTNSSEDDFKYDFTKYINIENYTKFIAIKNYLNTSNSKLNLFDSYYIYFDLKTETIKFIPWDEKYSLDEEELTSYKILEKIYSSQEIRNFGKEEVRDILSNFSGEKNSTLKEKYKNSLENKFLENTDFENLYKKNYKNIESDLEETNFIQNLEVKINILIK